MPIPEPLRAGCAGTNRTRRAEFASRWRVRSPDRRAAVTPVRRGKSGAAKGSALLTVLWLAAALSAVAFAVATTVRGETERATNAAEGTRAYYLAAGAVERAALHVLWGRTYVEPNGVSRYYSGAMPVLPMAFPGGMAVVEVIPENAKLNVNTATVNELSRLLGALRVNGERAREIVMAIEDWRKPSSEPTLFDQFYLSMAPSFRARHASFEEIEEVLLVRGMTTDLFYGSYDRNPANGALVPRVGLKDCLSVFGNGASVDVNTAPAPVLTAVGVPPEAADAIVQRRRFAPFRTEGDLAEARQAAGQGGGRLRIGGNSIFTLRATARLRLPNGRLSDLRRTVAGTIKILTGEPGTAQANAPYHFLRWYDSAWSE
jgi:general secretion pathway protein K